MPGGKQVAPEISALLLCCRPAGMTKLSSTLAMESKSYAKRATDLHRQVRRVLVPSIDTAALFARQLGNLEGMAH